MNVTFQTRDLLPTISRLSFASGSPHTLPSLSMVLIEALDSDSCVLTTTNIEIEKVCVISAKGQQTGETALVSAKNLFEICKRQQEDDEITLSFSDNKASVHTKTAKYQLNSLPSVGFPRMEEEDLSENTFSIRQDDLKLMLDKVSFSMAQNDPRYALNGLFFETQGQEIIAVATDGHRLAVCHTKQNEGAGNHQVIIPKKAVQEIQKNVQDNDRSVQISLNSTLFRVKLDNLVITTKLISGQYPEYKRVVPSEFLHTISVDTQAFKKTMELGCIVLQNERSSAVNLQFSPGLLRISAKNKEGEMAEAEQTIDYTGEEVKIGFNPEYLKNVISVADSEKLVFQIKDPNSGVLLTEDGMEFIQYVIMPVRR